MLGVPRIKATGNILEKDVSPQDVFPLLRQVNARGSCTFLNKYFPVWYNFSPTAVLNSIKATKPMPCHLGK